MINLYNEQNLQDIEFIEKKANFYQLCQLYFAKKGKKDINYSDKVQSFIQNYQFVCVDKKCSYTDKL